MIRSAWLILSTMSIANLMLLLIGAGWLHTTGRLSPDRLQETKSLYELTVDEALRLEQERAAKTQKTLDELVAMGFEDSIPLDSEAATDLVQRFNYIRTENFAQEVANIEVLRSALDTDLRRLANAREEFNAERDQFERRQQAIADREGSEQFQKAVKLYGITKAESAKEMMSALIDQGETDQVVAYLDALKPDVTSKILDKFLEDDPALAADLLERIRSYGIESTIAEEPPEL